MPVVIEPTSKLGQRERVGRDQLADLMDEEFIRSDVHSFHSYFIEFHDFEGCPSHCDSL